MHSARLVCIILWCSAVMLVTPIVLLRNRMPGAADDLLCAGYDVAGTGGLRLLLLQGLHHFVRATAASGAGGVSTIEEMTMADGSATATALRTTLRAAASKLREPSSAAFMCPADGVCPATASSVLSGSFLRAQNVVLLDPADAHHAMTAAILEGHIVRKVEVTVNCRFTILAASMAHGAATSGAAGLKGAGYCNSCFQATVFQPLLQWNELCSLDDVDQVSVSADDRPCKPAVETTQAALGPYLKGQGAPGMARSCQDRFTRYLNGLA